MPELTLFRIELLHVALIHFPIAMLSTATGVGLVALVFPRIRPRAQSLGLFLLVFGLLGSAAAIWSGEEAESIVNRVICDPTITQLHEERAWMATYYYLAALTALALRCWTRPERQRRSRHTLGLATVIFLSVGFYELVQTAHDGASLVYLQGAAVYHPSPQCTEFE